MAGSAELEIGASRTKFHRFYGPEMTDFGRFPGFRISDAPPTYSPVLMYLEIQVLAGFPELEIATFTKTFRCFEISGNTRFGCSRELVIATFAMPFPRFEVPGNPGFRAFRD